MRSLSCHPEEPFDFAQGRLRDEGSLSKQQVGFKGVLASLGMTGKRAALGMTKRAAE
jgi:hypothetical protein